jgi:hypothetical protein
MVKYTGTSTFRASGKGGRSTGIGVMPSVVTGVPSVYAKRPTSRQLNV